LGIFAANYDGGIYPHSLKSFLNSST